MMHVVLDSSIFRQCPRLDSTDFKLLARLMGAGQVVLHVPYVVEREHTSYLEQVQRKRIADASNNISKALDHVPLGTKSKDLKLTLEQLRCDLDDLVFERVSAFSQWLEEHKAIRHTITLEQLDGALEAYFKGYPPLKNPKTRGDIPDSFIFQQIISLQKCYGSDLEVVVADGALRAACESIAIDCWSDLLKFITSPKVRDFFAEQKIMEHSSVVCEHVLQIAKVKSGEIAKYIEEELLSGNYSTIYGDNFPGESGEIYLSGISAPHRVDIEGMEYIGDRLFMAEVHAETELMYQFALPIMDAIELDPREYSTSFLNDHYSEVEVTHTFHFSGRLELEFGECNVAADALNDLLCSLKEPEIRIADLYDFALPDDSEDGSTESEW